MRIITALPWGEGLAKEAVAIKGRKRKRKDMGEQLNREGGSWHNINICLVYVRIRCCLVESLVRLLADSPRLVGGRAFAPWLS